VNTSVPPTARNEVEFQIGYDKTWVGSLQDLDNPSPELIRVVYSDRNVDVTSIAMTIEHPQRITADKRVLDTISCENV
jgi:hypothetical protein